MAKLETPKYVPILLGDILYSIYLFITTKQQQRLTSMSACVCETKVDSDVSM